MTHQESPSLSELLQHTSRAHMQIENFQQDFKTKFEPYVARAIESHVSLAILNSYELYIEPLHIEVRKITTNVYNITLQLHHTINNKVYVQPIAVLQYQYNPISHELVYVEQNHNLSDPSVIVSQQFPSKQDFERHLDSLINKFK